MIRDLVWAVLAVALALLLVAYAIGRLKPDPEGAGSFYPRLANHHIVRL